MKKTLLIFGFLVLIPTATALLSEDIHLGRIRIGDYGYVVTPEMHTYVYVFNDGDSSLKDASVSMRIMDTDVYDISGQFDLKRGHATSKSMMTDIDLPAGEYLVRVSLRANNIHRVKYRYITII